MNKKNENTKRSFIPKSIGESIKTINQIQSNKLGKIDFLIYSKWKEIVGNFFSNHSEPTKITQINNYNNNEDQTSKILCVNVNPAAALEFEHFKDKIIEKINSYFGYKAIVGIKIYQNFHIKKEEKISPKNNKTNRSTKDIKKEIDKINNKDLEESIVNLGLSISREEK